MQNKIKFLLASSILCLKLSAQTQEIFKKEALKLGQSACFLITASDNPYFKIVRPDLDEIKTFECGCFDKKNQTNRHVEKGNIQDLENLIPLRLTTLGYGSHTKYDMKYKGQRKAVMGKILETIFLPNEQYQGKIIFDEYKANYPMWWILNNVEEFKAISNYLRKKLEESGFIPTQKTLLVLTVFDDPEMKTFNQEDKIFIEKYFELLPLTDKEVKKFFEKAKDILITRGFEMNASNPFYVGETLSQSIFRQVESKCKKWKAKDIAIAAVVTGLIALPSIIAFLQLKDEINTGSKRIFEKATGIKWKGTWVDTIADWKDLSKENTPAPVTT